MAKRSNNIPQKYIITDDTLKKNIAFGWER